MQVRLILVVQLSSLFGGAPMKNPLPPADLFSCNVNAAQQSGAKPERQKRIFPDIQPAKFSDGGNHTKTKDYDLQNLERSILLDRTLDERRRPKALKQHP